MRWFSLAVLLIAAPTWAQSTKTQSVSVTNFPSTQNVNGSVNVSNLPAVQDVNVVNGCSGGAGKVQLLGFTQAEVVGSTGFFALIQTCNAEFPGSQVCTSQQVLETTVIPASLSGSAWVRPAFQPNGSRALDSSGFTLDGLNFTCSGWSNGEVPSLIVDASGAFGLAMCATPRPVACCGVPQ